MPDELFADVPALGPQDLEHSARKLSDDRNIAILADLNDGLSYRSIAAKYDVGLGTVARLAAKMQVHKNITRNYMIAQALEVAEDWRDASKEAAKKGDHRPAKDWLLHAQEIEPLADTGAGHTGVTIVIGTGLAPAAQPPAFPSPQVIDTQALPSHEPD